MSGEHTLKAVRGSFIDVTRTVDNPEEIASALRFIEDGLLLIKQGKVEWFGEWENGKHQIPDTIRVRDYRGKLIVPGFVDTHIHYSVCCCFLLSLFLSFLTVLQWPLKVASNI